MFANQAGATHRTLFFLFAVLLVASSPSTSSAQTNSSTWRPNIQGNWGVAGNWTPSGVPNNTPPVTYGVTINSGVTYLNLPVTITSLRVTGGSLNLQTNAQTPVLNNLQTDSLLVSGGIIGGDGKLRVTGDLVMRGGSIQTQSYAADGFLVGGDIYKRGYGYALLGPANGNDYDIVIEQGKFQSANGGLGSTAGSVSIASTEFARLEPITNTNIEDDIYLNNARGFSGTGAFAASGGSVTLGGELYLGDQGAVIGAIQGGIQSGVIDLLGRIHGGNLDAVGNGAVRISGSDHDYSGTTRVGMNGDRTIFDLRTAGQLHSTSGIHVGGNASLVASLDQLGINRIGDAIPITLYGGTVSILGVPTSALPPSPFLKREKLGVLTLAQGASAVNLERVSGLEFQSIHREGQATIDFGFSTLEAAAEPYLQTRFTEAPALVNSILGGWATYDRDDFAAYDATVGVVPLANRVARPAQIEGAGVTSHVRSTLATPDFGTLTQDTNIATLAISYGGTRDIDLGGRTLTLAQGGLLRIGSGQWRSLIQNGSLTAGVSASPSSLFVSSETATSQQAEGVVIAAAVIDNAAGGPVSLVKSGTARLTLSGNNTYTGATIVQQGRLRIAAEGALPTGGEVVVDAGQVELLYTPTDVKRLERLVLAQYGLFMAPSATSSTAARISTVLLDADQIELESGNLLISLTGDGAIHKRTQGVVEIGSDSPNYTGAVTIHQGVLVAGSFQGFQSAPNALGLGETTILPGGTLIHGSVIPGGGNFQLNARLNLAGGDVGLTRTVSMSQWDFHGASRVSAPSRLLLFDPQGHDDIVAPVVNLTKRLAMSANLAVLGEGTASFTGGLSVAGDVTLDAQGAAVTIGGSIISADSGGGALRLRGPGSFALPGQLGPASPGPLTVDLGVDSIANVPSGQLTLSHDATLIVNGRLNNSQPILLTDGKLAGSGIVGNVNNQSGEVSPGNSIGMLTTGSFNQGAGGLLTMELLAGPPHTSDLIRATSATLDGTLHAVLAPGGFRSVGTTFNLVIANTISISSLQLTTSGIDGFHPWLFVNQIVGGPDVGKQVLQLMLVPEPAGASLALMTAAALTALLRRRSSQV